VTDKLQPLDVVFFAQMKRAWRAVLLNFKTSNPEEATIPKTVFTGLLKTMMDQFKQELHILTALEKCGLYLINTVKALEQIPHVLVSDGIAKNVDASLLKRLEENWFKKERTTKGRGKKMIVEAGRSYASLENSEDSNSSDS
jgi:hypothetical protein